MYFFSRFLGLSLIYCQFGISSALAFGFKTLGRSENQSEMTSTLLETRWFSDSNDQIFPFLWEQLPLRVRSGFGTGYSVRTPLENLVRGSKVSEDSEKNTVLVGSANQLFPLCGPSRLSNTLDCFDLYSGALLGRQPVPGKVTTTPVFFDDSWFFGTSEGFMISTTLLNSIRIPLISENASSFWGGWSRYQMLGLRNQNVGSTINLTAKALGDKLTMPPGWKWFRTSSGEFLGTPIIHRNKIFVVSADQFLHAFDIKTGKNLWVARLGPETPLRLANYALVARENAIFVGTEAGEIVAHDENTGAQLWRYGAAPIDFGSFKTVSAKPAVVGDSLIFSHAEFLTTSISLQNQKVRWTLPFGSLAQILASEKYLFLGSSRGEILKVDAVTGQIVWQKRMPSNNPIKSLQISPSGVRILVLNHQGEVFELSSTSAEVLNQIETIGAPSSEFFEGTKAGEFCHSLTQIGVRCFSLL